MSSDPQNYREAEIKIEDGIPVLPSAEDRAMRERSEKEAREEQRKEEQHGFNARQTSILERQEMAGSQMVNLTLGLFVVSLITAGASCYQAKVGHDSAKAAVTSAEVAQQTLKDSRIAAKESEKRMAELEDGMRKSVNAFIQQAENSRRMTDVVRTQAQRFFQENSQNFLEQRRAWFALWDVSRPAIDSPDGPVYLAVGRREAIAVIYKNYGLTPALRSTRFVHVMLWPLPAQEPPPFQIIGRQSQSIVPPDTANTIFISFPFEDHLTVTDEQLRSIKNGSARLYLRGAAKYFDIGNRMHETTFCKFLSQDLKHFIDCPFGNSIN